MFNYYSETIREYLLSEINKAFDSIELYDEEGTHIDKYDFSTNMKSTNDFYERLWHVLNERKIPFITLEGDKKVYIRLGFVKGLDSYLSEDKYYKSMHLLSKVLDWEYKAVYTRLYDKRVITGFKLDFEEFLSFVYP